MTFSANSLNTATASLIKSSDFSEKLNDEMFLRFKRLSIEDKHSAAIKIQSLFRGFRVRQSSYLPKHIYALIIDYKLVEIFQKALILCRELNDVLEHPPKNTKHFVLLNVDQKKHLIPIFDSQNNYKKCQSISIKDIAYLKVSKSKILTLYILFNQLGIGSQKIVINTNLVEIYNRQFISKPKVLMFPAEYYFEKKEVKIRDQEDNIYSETIIHKKLINILKDLSAHITPIPLEKVFINPYNSKIYNFWCQSWMNSNLKVITDKYLIPVSNKPNAETIPFTVKDAFKVICDVTKVLKEFHNNNIIHFDVKHENIFIKLTDDKKVVGVLGDFGMTGNVWEVQKKQFYYKFWDWSARFGEYTIFTDYYGLTMTLAELFLPQFDEILSHCQKNDHSLDRSNCHLLEDREKILHEFYIKMKLDVVKYLEKNKHSLILSSVNKSSEIRTLTILEGFYESKQINKFDFECISFEYKFMILLYELVFEAIFVSQELHKYFEANPQIKIMLHKKISSPSVFEHLNIQFPFAKYFQIKLNQINELLHKFDDRSKDEKLSKWIFKINLLF